tara:strand:- start:135 stop:788 length:654 start_codon:yes stop_codon:yes gene_type:complete
VLRFVIWELIIKNNIKMLAAKADYSIPALAAEITARRGKKMSAAALRCYTRVPQERQPNKALAEVIADILHCSVSEVIGELNKKDLPVVKKIPLYGADTEGFADNSNVSAPVDYIVAHPNVAKNVNAYAVMVSGVTMTPRFRAGEIVFCSPGIPPRAGDDVCIIYKESQSTKKAIIKQFLNADEESIYVTQHNPVQQITVEKHLVESIHTICGITIT